MPSGALSNDSDPQARPSTANGLRHPHEEVNANSVANANGVPVAAGSIGSFNLVVNPPVMAGGPEHGGITHVISSPQHVWIRQEINGCDNAVLIENAAGHMVLIELEAAPGSDRNAVSALDEKGCAPEKCAAR